MAGIGDDELILTNDKFWKVRLGGGWKRIRNDCLRTNMIKGNKK